jgi:hypothetical protein
MNNTTKINNINLLPFFSSYSQLSSHYIDIANTFILPSISFVGIITSLICIIVLKHLTTGVNQYLLLFSISDFIFAVSCFSIGFIRCGSFCSFGYSYGSKIVELYIYIFITNSCLVFSILIDLEITIKKLKSFSIKYRNQIKIFLIKENKLKIFIYIFVSLFVNVVIYFITREVKAFGYLTKIDNSTKETLYTVSNTMIGRDKTMQNFVLALTLLRGLFLILLLLIINFGVLIKYRNYIFRKQLIRNSTSIYLYYIFLLVKISE